MSAFLSVWLLSFGETHIIKTASVSKKSSSFKNSTYNQYSLKFIVDSVLYIVFSLSGVGFFEPKLQECLLEYSTGLRQHRK